jgi:hypothetical protein
VIRFNVEGCGIGGAVGSFLSAGFQSSGGKVILQNLGAGSENSESHFCLAFVELPDPDDGIGLFFLSTSIRTGTFLAGFLPATM